MSCLGDLVDYFSEAETKVDKLARLEPTVWPAEQSLARFALSAPPSFTPSAPFLCSPVVSTVRAGQEGLWRGQSIEEGLVGGGVPDAFHYL